MPVIETYTISMTVQLRLEECGNISIAETAIHNIAENIADLRFTSSSHILCKWLTPYHVYTKKAQEVFTGYLTTPMTCVIATIFEAHDELISKA